jgi:hypothetical protein
MSSRPTPRRYSDGPESAHHARQRDFEKWESELPAASRFRARRATAPVSNWFRTRVSGPVVKWCHVVGRSVLAPERFL